MGGFETPYRRRVIPFEVMLAMRAPHKEALTRKDNCAEAGQSA
jgi:hypothetical protein